MPVSLHRIDELLAAFRSRSVLVIGDLMLDEFLWGKVSRISPEAPVPVVEVQRSSSYPGGAANVARNLCDFAKATTVAGVVGQDEAGDRLLGLLKEEGVGVKGVTKVAGRPTTLKTRIIARQQQVVRVDRETRQVLSEAERHAVMQEIGQILPDYDAVIVEDYAKGLIDQALASFVIGECTRMGKTITIDPNPTNPLDWSRATAIKPNRSEAFLAAGIPSADGMEPLLRAGEILRKKWRTHFLLITLGEEGMMLLEDGAQPYHTPTRAQEVFDVSGAGDTAIAFFTLALASGATGVEAAEIANHAAGVVVGKLGTATLTPAELRESFVQHLA
ncbi:D-glycero-beta-D-manno-heptose-7-phosphate kinase [Verrucomicrobia bacterium LW23]|nr:D-glycero-beta-D-manno-heptose-7-phosphate kinase [Verrucomicrobia bacterium LW23]